MPSDLVQPPAAKNGSSLKPEEGDNSSSGVSSDQENERKKNEAKVTTVTKNPPGPQFERKNFMEELSINTNKILNGGGLKKAVNQPVTTKITNSIVTRMISESVEPKIPPKKMELKNVPSLEERSENDDESPSPPSVEFQFKRHNSLTRKQAAMAAQRAKAMQDTMRAVSLAKLPPPIEHDDIIGTDAVVLAPPPEFCDFMSSSSSKSKVKSKESSTKVKSSRLHSQ